MRLLVVDDEAQIHEVIKQYGLLYGYEVISATNGRMALEIVFKMNIDAVVLDIMMPDMDGFAVTKKIKEIADIPIIMLSARHQEDDKLYGFKLGIDDYMTKPFSVKELMARINVISERNNHSSNSGLIHLSLLTVDTNGRFIMVGDEKKQLTGKEYDLLLFFIQHQHQLLSRETILNHVWGVDFYGDQRVVDAHVKMLRKHLGKARDYIQTIRGVGYRFEVV